MYVRLRQKMHSINTKFHIRHRSGMIVYFERASAAITNQDSGLLLNPAVQSSFNMKRKSISENSFSTRTLNNEQQKQLSYRFSLSWPSCMHLDFFNGKHMCPAYIRQWYSVPNKHTDDEEMRCYTQNGEILKFMKDESVIVYYPNGKIYHHMLTRSSSTSFRNSKSFGTNSQKIFEGENDEYDYTGKESNSIHECEQTFQDFTNGTLKTELSNGVVVTHTYNGDLVVDFPDGSRITSLLECELQVVVDDDTIFENHSSSNDGNDCDEEFVVISAHYLIEHAYFASVSSNRFGNEMKVGLPHGLSISIDSENDRFLVNLSDESRIEVEKSEIIVFDGNSLRSSVLLSNIQEYSSTYPQFDRYEFFNCKVDSKCVLVVDSWGDISADHLYFRENCTNEFDNTYYIVRNDLSGYKIYPSDFETKLDQLTGNKQQCVINKSVNSGHKSALFIQPSEASREWKMNFQSYNTFQRSQSTVDCCRFSWLNPISIVRNEKLPIIIDESPQLLTIGLLQWFKSREQCNESKSANRNKIIHNAIIRDNDYRAAMEIYSSGDQCFPSERHQVIDQAEAIVSQTLKRAQSFFSRREKLNKINRYKQLLKHDKYCKYFDTKVGMSFLIADEIVTHVLSKFRPREIGKFISSSVTEELIKIAIDKAELQKINREIGKLISSSVYEELIENVIEKAELQGIHSDMIG
ncbi:hypothetical protein LSTR_LSTR016161 [Laodelphax striatellus]|nr:hypothetical protein LSTR_LSTR016161 [Laodelphax striatellus]